MHALRSMLAADVAHTIATASLQIMSAPLPAWALDRLSHVAMAFLEGASSRALEHHVELCMPKLAPCRGPKLHLSTSIDV